MDYFYEDDLVPQLVPPEDDLIPQLVPPPQIEIIEFPVLIEIPVEVPIEVPVQQHVLQIQQQIPQYILNGYIDSLVAKKETCPILLTELTLETTHITPCGHALSKEGLDAWLETSESCPVCRSPCTYSQLQYWKP